MNCPSFYIRRNKSEIQIGGSAEQVLLIHINIVMSLVRTVSQALLCLPKVRFKKKTVNNKSILHFSASDKVSKTPSTTVKWLRCLDRKKIELNSTNYLRSWFTFLLLCLLIVRLPQTTSQQFRSARTSWKEMRTKSDWNFDAVFCECNAIAKYDTRKTIILDY